MRRVLTVLATVAAAVMTAIPANAAGPPFQAGPKGGDQFTYTSEDPQTGTVEILQINARQGASVHCVGQGPFATLEVTQPVTGHVSGVSVAYRDATYMQTVVLNVDVVGSRSGALGHGDAFGPQVAQTGTVDVPLVRSPVPGEDMTVQFGLQVHAGCLPDQPVGLPGSRPVEGGRVTFTSATVR